MADTVRIPDSGRVPQAAIIMGVIGSLYDKLRLPMNGKRICGIAYQRGVGVRRGFTGAAKGRLVHKYAGRAEGFRQIEGHGAVSLQEEAVGGAAVRVAVCMEGGEVGILPDPCHLAPRRDAVSKILREKKLVRIDFPAMHKKTDSFFWYYGNIVLCIWRCFCILIIITGKQPYSCKSEENCNDYGKKWNCRFFSKQCLYHFYLTIKRRAI